MDNQDDYRTSWPTRPIGGLSFLASRFLENQEVDWRPLADYGKVPDSQQAAHLLQPQTPVESGEELPEVDL